MSHHIHWLHIHNNKETSDCFFEEYVRAMHVYWQSMYWYKATLKKGKCQHKSTRIIVLNIHFCILIII